MVSKVDICKVFQINDRRVELPKLSYTGRAVSTNNTELMLGTVQTFHASMSPSSKPK